jgi:hypothetical protein
VYELSLIEQVPNIESELKKDYNINVNFERAKHLLEENDGAGNTFKATAKPVLIGTAVVGATTMTFSIIMALTRGLTENVNKLSLLHAPFVLGLISGGAIIYWFTGASTQAVTTGAYRAVEFIKANIKLDGVVKASVADSKKVVEICTKYAQKGMFNIFLAVFFVTLAFAFVEPFFFIGCLGQRQEDRRSRPQTKGHAATRCDGYRRHRGRSFQGHIFGGHEPDHQVHHAVRVAGCGAGGAANRNARRDLRPHPRGHLLRCFVLLRVPLVLRYANCEGQSVTAGGARLRA